MMALFRLCGRMLRLRRWRPAAVILLFALSGCAGWNVRDEGFAENDLSESVRKARPQKSDIDYWSFSNKGRQIERDLHSM
jgi:hypothetical protein